MTTADAEHVEQFADLFDPELRNIAYIHRRLAEGVPLHQIESELDLLENQERNHGKQ